MGSWGPSGRCFFVSSDWMERDFLQPVKFIWPIEDLMVLFGPSDFSLSVNRIPKTSRRRLNTSCDSWVSGSCPRLWGIKLPQRTTQECRVLRSTSSDKPERASL